VVRILRPVRGPLGQDGRTFFNASYKSRGKVRIDIQCGALHPYISIFDYGRKADAEVRTWLGLKSWGESWGKTQHIVRRKGIIKIDTRFGS
jgi:hypothetical protein